MKHWGCNVCVLVVVRWWCVCLILMQWDWGVSHSFLKAAGLPKPSRLYYREFWKVQCFYCLAPLFSKMNIYQEKHTFGCLFSSWNGSHCLYQVAKRIHGRNLGEGLRLGETETGLHSCNGMSWLTFLAREGLFIGVPVGGEFIRLLNQRSSNLR